MGDTRSLLDYGSHACFAYRRSFLLRMARLGCNFSKCLSSKDPEGTSEVETIITSIIIVIIIVVIIITIYYYHYFIGILVLLASTHVTTIIRGF